MHYLHYREQIKHRTGDLPLAYYFVDEHFPRYRMPAHWHKETEAIRVRSGRLQLYLDEEELTMEAGDVLTVSGGVIHGGDPEGCVYECVVFDAQALLPGIGSARAGLQQLQQHNLLIKNGSIGDSRVLDTFFELAAGDIQGHSLEMLCAALNFLTVPAGEGPGIRRSTVSRRNWQKAEQIKPALEYIEKNYSTRITLSTLAGLAGFSPKYFCRYFKSVVHRTPIDYLNYYRVECAAHLLTDGNMNVAEVAARCGFADSSAFIKQFRRYKGDTPKCYKSRMLESRGRGRDQPFGP